MFKVGDKVKCTRARNSADMLIQNKIYTVTAVDKSNRYIGLRGVYDRYRGISETRGEWMSDRFELVKTSKLLDIKKGMLK